ncbi:PREDICTED: uncharacterized protein LOC109211824 isoform X2 [Nicotiana attenuata]|uniref:uncharacterized protein LOC109211824 isoform X2 n=1 Tax=Nicotiana attenuata TaxID=49451 RepID=UPI000905D6AC|nr:PREDICTED: uncharacterized protein LOC109211824 isoform X2 [Nicotiana attenuata]
MKDDESIPVSTPTTHSKNSTSDATLFGRGRYKFWALAGILLLAFWSMFTGTVTLRWSAGNLNGLSDYFNVPLSDDLDVIEMEEREKLVKHMWDVYTNTPQIRLPKFWQEAFEAAYEELTSDLADIREAAISEISKMSLRFVHMELPPLHSLQRLKVSRLLAKWNHMLA